MKKIIYISKGKSRKIDKILKCKASLVFFLNSKKIFAGLKRKKKKGLKKITIFKLFTIFLKVVNKMINRIWIFFTDYLRKHGNNKFSK